MYICAAWLSSPLTGCAKWQAWVILHKLQNNKRLSPRVSLAKHDKNVTLRRPQNSKSCVSLITWFSSPFWGCTKCQDWLILRLAKGCHFAFTQSIRKLLFCDGDKTASKRYVLQTVFRLNFRRVLFIGKHFVPFRKRYESFETRQL